MNHKLNIKCNRIIFVLKFFLYLIPPFVIFSWLFPTNFFSTSFYLGPLLNSSLKEYGNFTNHFIWNNKLIGLAGSFFSLMPLILGLHWLVKVFKNYAKGNIFTIYNAKIYSRLGYLCILSSLFFNPIGQMLFSVAISINNQAGHRYIAFGVDSTNLTALICGLSLITIAKVMQAGHQIEEERNLTV